jgi:adenosylmethionine-8-amino-7-oxononanoate aminotransferase
MRMCRPGFVREVTRRLRTRGILLVFDEVMTGFGRTGELFAARKAGVTPDIICLSKGLTGGFLPLSVTVASEAVYETFLGADFDRAFTHGHSFTANSLGCAAANASLDLLETGDASLAWARIESAHAAFLDRLDGHPRVSRRRLTGTIAAFDVSDEQSGYNAAVGPALKKAFFERGLLLRPLGNVVYFLPPYCVDDAQLARAYDAVVEVLDELD